MKTRLLVIFVCMLFLTIPISHIIPAEEQGAALEIEFFGGFKTGIVLRNIGDTDALFVNWNISIDGGFIKKINVSKSGFIGSLPPHNGMIDLVITLPSDQISGFGRVTIKATADSLLTSKIEKEIDGLLFFFFVILLK
jgi:hypothetical protein